MIRTLQTAAILLTISVVASAQWDPYPWKRVPRTADGKVDLNAAPLRTSYGKIDLSGFWMPENITKHLLNLAADMKEQDIPLKPGDPSHDLVREVQDGLQRFAHVPMLICWGGLDFVFDDGFLAEWQRRFPAAEVHRFADAGHLVLEDAGERIVPLVKEFLGRRKIEN